MLSSVVLRTLPLEPAQDDPDLFREVGVGSKLHQSGLDSSTMAASGPFECAEQKKPASAMTTVSREGDDVVENFVVCRGRDRYCKPVLHPLVRFLAIQSCKGSPAHLRLGDCKRARNS